MKIGRRNWSSRRKPAPAPLCPPQIPLDQTRARTRAASVGSQRLTACTMALKVFMFSSVCQGKYYNSIHNCFNTYKTSYTETRRGRVDNTLYLGSPDSNLGPKSGTELPITSSPIRYSLIILTFDARLHGVLKALINKPRIKIYNEKKRWDNFQTDSRGVSVFYFKLEMIITTETFRPLASPYTFNSKGKVVLSLIS
jgi:hypothetical protein